MLLIDDMKVLRGEVGVERAVRGATEIARVTPVATLSRWKENWEARRPEQVEPGDAALGGADRPTAAEGVGLGARGRGQPGGPAPLSLNATATMHRLLLRPAGLEFKQPT